MFFDFHAKNEVIKDAKYHVHTLQPLREQTMQVLL
jgi:hypothetical protein